MGMNQISLFLATLLLLAGCEGGYKQTESNLMGARALLWTQYSAEAEALYLQGYHIAEEIVRNYQPSHDQLPPAVVLDIDETVLDNSPFNVNMLREGFAYSEEKWAGWCELREATPLPGALDFINLADSLGIEVFYISNRAAALMDATIDNLVAYGFPNADEAHLLLKSNTSSKDERRAAVRSDYEIILLMGDNLGDFDGVFDDRSVENGKPAVYAHSNDFGTRFIIFPNPVYGTWERGIFPEGEPGENEILQKLRGY
jgi:5'-nucleotidase (lipoprotein e(P4) family)